MPDDITMDWPDAMRAVRDGFTVRRLAWDDTHAVVRLYQSTLAIYREGQWRPWIIAADDVTAADWVL